jgi:hypothetical protein
MSSDTSTSEDSAMVSSPSPLSTRRRESYKAMVSSRSNSGGGGGGGCTRERFLARCAERLRQERRRAVERTRRDLPRADDEQHRMAEEEEFLRRVAIGEWKRYQRRLESDVIELEEEDDEDNNGEGWFAAFLSLNDVHPL